MAPFDQLTLHTERLLLRPMGEADAQALFGIFSNDDVSRYLPRRAWTEMASAHERIAKDIAGMASGDHLRLGLERLEDGVLVGEVCLFNFNEQCRRAELGYGLARPHWGNGYVNEALQTLVEYSFRELGLNRIEADIDPRNEASARTLERLGFTKEGHLRDRWIVEGEVSDTGLYGLLAQDWAAKRPVTTPVAPHLRIARPVRDLAATRAMYCAGLGLAVIGSFEDHEGFDGVMLGAPNAGYHFEFTHCRHHPVAPTPTSEDLAVFYFHSGREWEQACARMHAAGFRQVESFNPYWDTNGRTYEDADGYRVVIQNAPWRTQT